MTFKIKQYSPLLITIILFIVIYFIGNKVPEETIRTIIYNAGPFGVIIFILLTWLTYIFAPLGGTPFLFTGFYLFGKTVIFYTFIAAFIASITNFWIARLWGISIVEKLTGKVGLNKVNTYINSFGLFSLFFSRIFLGQFHDALSYAFGLTSIPFISYLIVSTLGMIPGTIVWYLISSHISNALTFTLVNTIFAYVFFMFYLMWRRFKTKTISNLFFS